MTLVIAGGLSAARLCNRRFNMALKIKKLLAMKKNAKNSPNWSELKYIAEKNRKSKEQ